MKRIISSVLVLATLLGCLAVLPLGISAWENGDTLISIPVSNPTDYTNPILHQVYPSAQAKLDGDPNMQMYAMVGSKQLWANRYSGEVYVKDVVTGQILTSNPYNTTAVSNTSDIIRQTLSQLVVNYNSTTSANMDSGIYLYSFKESAERGQITLAPIANGIRMDYAIGDTTKRYILPYGIMANDFIEIIMIPLHKQTEQQMREMAEASGVPEDMLNRYFDFESFCTRYINLYGTYQKYGVEYTYGNIDAFDEWSRQAANFYTRYYTYEDYDTNQRKRRSAESQATMSTPEDMNKLQEDFNALNQAYVEFSPYIGRRKHPNRKDWTLDEERIAAYPILQEKAVDPETGEEYYCNSIFALDTTLTSKQLRLYESKFSTYAPNFTLDDALAAEEETGVEAQSVVNPVFYVSLEYVLNADGVTVFLPATSLVYDESLYTVNYIAVLPYMGSGDVRDGGYIFYPDGSGALVEFEDYSTSSATVSGKVYGQDYAYYSISGKHQESISMPVYGSVKNEDSYYFVSPFDGRTLIQCTREQYEAGYYEITYTKDDKNRVYAVYPFGQTEQIGYYIRVNPDGTTQKITVETDQNKQERPEYYKNAKTVVSSKSAFSVGSKSKNGYLAIIEEGAALAEIRVLITPQSNNPMTRVYPTFVPRCKDSYNLSDSIDSITDANATFTVFADKKYAGSYTTRFVMLTDDTIAAEKGITSYYPASYVGMAAAYQQYLIDAGVLSANGTIEEQLPLFIESFGVMQTTKKFLSIPFTVDVALTSFEDVQTMYRELSERGIGNIKFRLTGFTNGGMSSTYPVKLSWESEAGGKSGFKELLAFAAEQSGKLEIFPNFNFAYVYKTGTFDGISLKKIGARSVDNRYAYRKSYNSVYQAFTSYNGGILVTPSKLEGLFEKFATKYGKYDTSSISLAYMASDLSSDFGEDNAVNRDESLNYVVNMLRRVRESGYTSVMSDGGNVYALAYVDYLLKAPIDSSHYRSTSRTVPFWGMVMHGYIQYAGKPFNEQSNKNEALLRAIESGASLYFLLSYDNTRLMKDDVALSDYYSVNYQISKDTVEHYYNLLNEAIGDLQNYRIVDHKVILTERLGIESDVKAQRLELQAEFMEQLNRKTLEVLETQRAILRDLIDIGIDVGDAMTYDADGNGVLEGAEIDNAFPSSKENKFQTFVRKYSEDSRIASIIGDEDLTQEASLYEAVKKVFAAVVNGEISLAYGQTIGVTFNTEAVLAAARRILSVEALDTAFEEEIRAYIAETAAAVGTVDLLGTVGDFTYQPTHSYFTVSNALDEDYKMTESTVSDGTVVMVTYSNGTDSVSFVLNYNVFNISIRLDGQEPFTLGKYGFRRLS